MDKKIAVLIGLTREEQERMRREAAGCELFFAKASEITRERLAGVSAVIGNPPARLLAGLEGLEWVQLQSAGTDPYDRELPRGVALTNAAGCYGPAVSEHMLAMLLSLLKKLPLYRDHQLRREWVDEGQVRSVCGARVLVAGLGDIGGHFAQKCKALGAYTVGLRRRPGEKPEWLDELLSLEALDGQLASADVVALFLPAAENTYHLFDAARLAKMKPGAVLLNGGRGNVVDMGALALELARGALAGAALDVTEPEPLPPESPLWDQKNCIITPHTAGGYHLQETVRRIVALCGENLGRYVRNEPLKNLVSRPD